MPELTRVYFSFSPPSSLFYDLEVAIILLYYLEMLGPGTLCSTACTQTNVFLSNKIWRDYERQNIACMSVLCSWGELRTTRFQKSKTPTAASEELGAKPEYSACHQHSTPPQGWTNHLSRLPAWSLDSLLPLPHVRNHLASPQGWSSKPRNMSLIPCSRGFNKALPESLV